MASNGDAGGFICDRIWLQDFLSACFIARFQIHAVRNQWVHFMAHRALQKNCPNIPPETPRRGSVPAERFFRVTSAWHVRRAVRHFERAGLQPIPAPTGFKTGSEPRYTWSYWLPSSGNLRKTERAVHEYLGLLALELDHRGRP